MSYNSGVGVGRECMIKEVGKVNRIEWRMRGNRE